MKSLNEFVELFAEQFDETDASEIQPFVYSGQGNVELLEDGMVLELFSGEPMRVIFTPGHDVSCISYVIAKNVFTGDSYLP